jgi:HlyD family secretion protein
MTANVTVRVATDAGVLRVPNAALRFRPSAELVALNGSNPSEAPGRRSAGATPRAANAGGPRAANAGGLRPPTASGSSGPAFGRVWVMRDGAAQEVRVRTGVTDGVLTAVREGDLREGDRVITAAAGLATSAAPAASASSPLLPVGRRGGGQGAAANRTGAGR